MILDKNGWLEVKGYIKTPAITLNNVSLQNTLDNYETSISNLNIIVDSIITNVNSVENSLENDIVNINTTLPSFLQTTKFNTTINSYLTISNFTSSSLLNTTAFNNTLTSNLSSYTPLTTYNNTILTSLNTINNNITNISYNSLSSMTYLNNDNIYSTTTANNKRLTLETTHSSGTPYFTLKCRNTAQSSIYQTNSNLYWAAESANLAMNFSVNNGTSTLVPLKIYSNGVINAGNLGSFNNKVLVLFDSGASDDPLTATNFYGFGVNSQALRYQSAVSTHTHKFYCGSTLSFTITNGAGASGSDIRFKSEIQNITNTLSIINNLQSKTFKYQDSTARQLGFIAQEIEPYIPEAVFTDTSDENNYKFIYYDKLVALMNEGIKELFNEIQALKK